MCCVEVSVSVWVYLTDSEGCHLTPHRWNQKMRHGTVSGLNHREPAQEAVLDASYHIQELSVQWLLTVTHCLPTLVNSAMGHTVYLVHRSRPRSHSSRRSPAQRGWLWTHRCTGRTSSPCRTACLSQNRTITHWCRLMTLNCSYRLSPACRLRATLPML